MFKNVLKLDAIIFGTIATIIIFLVNQLFFILIAAYSGLAGVEHEFWSQFKDLIWQVMGIATLCISMSLGGMLMRFLVDKSHWQNAFVVGAITGGLFILSVGERGELNATSVFVFFAGAVSCALGAHYSPWPKESATKKVEETPNPAN